MGEEDRGSSGGGTMVIVLAILAGILVLGCCGGVVVFGLGFVFWASPSADIQQNVAPPPTIVAPEEAPQVESELAPDTNLNPNLGPGAAGPSEAQKPATPPGEANTEPLEKKE